MPKIDAPPTPKLFFCDPNEVSVLPERFRREFRQSKLDDLKASIESKGQLHPIVLDSEKNLLAGERRLRACKELGRPVLCIHRKDIADPLLKLEIELEENLIREGLSPQEEVIAKAMIHEVKIKRYGEKKSGPSTGEGWGLGDTAEFLGQSKSQTADDVRLGKLVQHIPQLQKAKTKNDMKKELKKLLQQADFHEKSKAAVAAAEEELQLRADQEGVGRILLSSDYAQIKAKEFNDRLQLGDGIEGLFSLEERAQLIICDPPWGVELDQKLSDTTQGGSESYADSAESFKERFPRLAEALWMATSAEAHVYCFFGIIHFDFVYTELEKVGFQVNRRPIIWCKPGIRATRAPDQWPGAGYEPIAFARKGNRPLVKKAADWFSITPLSPSEKATHPSAKPHQVYQELLLRSAYPGDLVIDPMFGTGPCFQACELHPELSLRWRGWEINETFKAIALTRILKAMKGEG